MNTSILKLIGVTALLALLLAAAETKSAAQDTSDLQPVSWNQVPTYGTFWILLPTGRTPVPYPSRPQYVAGETIYAMSDGAYFVDARNVQNSAMLFMTPESTMSQQARFTPNTPPDRPLLVTSNAWFNQIVISNCTFVSVSNATFDLNGNIMTV